MFSLIDRVRHDNPRTSALVNTDPSSVYTDTLIQARTLSNDYLLALTDALQYEVADDDPAWPGEIGRFLASERLRAIHHELQRRERLHRAGRGVPSPTDRRYQGWHELGRLVRERVEVPAVFEAAGYELRRAGRNGRRGVEEFAGACPLCGGTDRLRVWAGPNGRAWCRQCALSWDVVTATQSMIPGAVSFRDAVRWLAELSGAGSKAPR